METQTDTDLGINEAEFEALLASVLKDAFPFLERSAVRHQLQFRVHLGRKQIEVDGRGYSKRGRLDILLKHKEQPLAILELKKPDLTLTDNDRLQGLSYARLMEPMPPLVIVTNGKSTSIFQTVGGQIWKPESSSEDALQNYIENCAKVAAQDVQGAIAALLGPSSDLVKRIIATLSSDYIAELSGDWGDHSRPFPLELSFPRRVTQYLIREFAKGQRFIVLSGPPLIGKSNVLREFFELSVQKSQAIVLLIEGSAIRQGLFRFIADAFSGELGWNITPEEARNWLIGISRDAPFRLIIAIDDANPEGLGTELDGIASNAFGPRVQMLLCCDTNSTEKFTLGPNSRQQTALGRKAVEVAVDRLDDEEFDEALRVLEGHRIGFFPGAKRAEHYRNPWILRTIASDVAACENHADQNVSAVIPSLPGLKLVDFAKQRFVTNEQLRGIYSEFSAALLEDIGSPDRALVTALIYNFVCRRSTLLEHITELDLRGAVDRGELKNILLEGDVRGVVAQIPELAALALSQKLGSRMVANIDDDTGNAVEELTDACKHVPLGDVIGAFALVEAARLRNGLPLPVLTKLLTSPPREEALPPGTKFRIAMGDGHALDAEVTGNAKLVVIGPDGGRHVLNADGEELGFPVANMTPWIILSYLAAMPLVAVDNDHDALGSLDTAVLAEVAMSPHVLRLPMNGAPDGILMHEISDEISVVCHQEGIVEPITLALMTAILRDRFRGDHLLELAIESNSVPFLMRLFTALQVASSLVGGERRAWVGGALQNVIAKLADYPVVH